MQKIKGTSVTLDENIAHEARVQAAILDISRSKLINTLLEIFLKDEQLQKEVLSILKNK